MLPQSLLGIPAIAGSVRAAVPFNLLSLCGAAKPPALTPCSNKTSTIPQQRQYFLFSSLLRMTARLQLVLSHLGFGSAGVAAESIIAGVLHTTGAAVQFKPYSTDLIARLVVVRLAEIVLTAKDNAGTKFHEAYDKAVECTQVIEGLVKEHPVYSTIIALGVLAILCPWIITALGFTLEGVAKGEHAHIST
jgi:hypothetical protein